jgi:NADH:ubiquinone oxidoreductase subunit 3 (subunit A)
LEAKFDFEYVIIGIIFLLAGISIIYLEKKAYKVNDENTSSFKYYSIRGAIILFMLAVYLIYNEVIKII